MRIWGFPNKLALLQALNGTHWIFYVAASPDSTYFNLSTIALFRYVRLGENEWLKWWLLLAFNYYLYANLVYNQCTDFAARAGARSFLIRSEKEKSIVLGWDMLPQCIEIVKWWKKKKIYHGKAPLNILPQQDRCVTIITYWKLSINGFRPSDMNLI